MKFFSRSVYVRLESFVGVCQGMVDVADSVTFGGVFGPNAREDIVKLTELLVDSG